jgi:ABC-2 type transport system permease protein
MLRNRLGRSSVWSVIGFIGVWMAAAGSGFGAAIGVSIAARLATRWSEIVVVSGSSLVALVWVVGPLVAASIEDSLDPRRFESLPIRPTQLAGGLLAAGMVGPGGFATVVGVVGAALAGFADVVSFVPILAAAIALVLLSVTSARFVTTALADLLRARRAREIAGVMVGLLAAIPGLASALFNTGTVRVGASSFDRLLVLRWLPPGALGEAVFSFSNHRWPAGLAGLAYGMTALLLVLRLYAWSVRRLQVVTDGSASVRSVADRTTSLRPRRVPLPAGAVGAVAAKELKYLRRDPRVRAQLVGALVGLVVIAAISGPALSSPYGPYLAAPVGFFAVVGLVVNQFGYDGGSFWAYVTVAPDLLTVLRGKNLAAMVFALPLTIVVAAAASVVAGTAAYLLAAVCGSVVVVLVWSTVGNVTSLIGPIRIPESNPFANRSVSGASFLASLVGMAGAGILLAPPVIAIALATWKLGAVWTTAVAAVAVGYAVGLYLISFKVLRPLIERNTPNVLAVIDRDV